MIPRMRPSSTRRSTSFNAMVVPYTFRRPRASIVAMVKDPPFRFLSGELPPDAAVLSNPDQVARYAQTRAANVRPKIFVVRPEEAGRARPVSKTFPSHARSRHGFSQRAPDT